MENLHIKAFLDFELTRKMEAFTINALPEEAYQSDFNMMYIANIETEEEDGIKYQTAVECDDTFFLSVLNDFGNIDYSIIKTIHVAGVFESDFEVMEFYPDPAEMYRYANYYEGKPIPIGGGFLEIAYSPFGVTKIEMINGDELQVYGNGRIKVDSNMIGFKGYSQIPKVQKMLSNDFLKIVKLAIYTRYKQNAHKKFNLNIFSPSMKIISEPIDGQVDISESRLIMYTRGDLVLNQNNIPVALIDLKNNFEMPAEVERGEESNLFDIDKMVRVTQHNFIDASHVGEHISGNFSIHVVNTIYEYANRGSIIFEMGYGLTSSGYQTHHLTLFVDNSGILCYNGQYSDEWVSTGFLVEKNIENIFTLTVENQKYDESDEDENVIFIHANGRQIWPEKKMYTATEKIYVWRSMEAYRTYSEVCMSLPSPHPVSGGLDSKTICAKKLLHESGFQTLENLTSIYQMYLDRPRPGKADPVDIIFGDTDNETIEKIFFGQDSEKDVFDSEYYLNGAFSEIAVFSPSLERDEIENMHLLNILKNTSVKID